MSDKKFLEWSVKKENYRDKNHKENKVPALEGGTSPLSRLTGFLACRIHGRGRGIVSLRLNLSLSLK